MNTFTVDYSKSLDRVIKEGKYTTVSGIITEKSFGKPTKKGKVTLEWKLFHFKRDDLSFNETVALIEAEGFRPATHFELATFGAVCSKEHGVFCIVALGSRSRFQDYHSSSHYAYLVDYGFDKKLYTGEVYYVIKGTHCYLGVREVSDSQSTETLEKGPGLDESSATAENALQDSMPKELTINGVRYVQALEPEYDLIDIHNDFMILASKVSALTNKK